MSKKYIIAKNVMTEYRTYVFEQKVKQSSQQDVEILSYEDRLEYLLVAEKVVKTAQEKVEKRKFLDFIYLSTEEYNKLIAEYGERTIKDFVATLNDYIGSKWDKYKSHYYTILMRLKKSGIRKLSAKSSQTAVVEKVLTEEERKQSLEILQKARNLFVA